MIEGGARDLGTRRRHFFVSRCVSDCHDFEFQDEQACRVVFRSHQVGPFSSDLRVVACLLLSGN